jgi:hypothetical protein
MTKFLVLFKNINNIALLHRVMKDYQRNYFWFGFYYFVLVFLKIVHFSHFSYIFVFILFFIIFLRNVLFSYNSLIHSHCIITLLHPIFSTLQSFIITVSFRPFIIFSIYLFGIVSFLHFNSYTCYLYSVYLSVSISFIRK